MTHELAGARCEIQDPEPVLRLAQALAADHRTEVSLADARSVFGRDHLESAALHAERSQATGMMATRSLAMETLLYLAGERQVAEAIRVAGIRPGTRAVGIVVFGEATAEAVVRFLGWTRDDSVLDVGAKSLDALSITKAERGTVAPGQVADLALERTALLDVRK